MAEAKPVVDPPTYQFTLVIITPDGQTVYTVEAADLPKIAKQQTAAQSGPEVHKVLDLSSPIAHVRYPDHVDVDLLGTFFINLSVYAPQQS